MKKVIWIGSIILILEIGGIVVFKNKNIFQNIKNKEYKEIVYRLPTPEIIQPKILEKETQQINLIVEEKIIIKTLKPTITPISKPIDDGPWGVAKQIDDHTWTMKIGLDEKMATPEEILSALNDYRRIHGSQILTMDDKLKKYAQERANYLNKKGSTDGHQGFNDFVENQNGFEKLGFTALGENISYGYKLNGVHVIEWMYAGDKPHNDNQLDNRWNYVGIGTDGLATCLIFGTGKS
jgi:hypothetical protein